MRDANEGVSLAAVVSRETTEGHWSGTGGGLGIGPDGLGFFVGGMSGTKREQTHRARSLEAPQQNEFRIGQVIAPVIGVLALGVAAKFIVTFSSVETQAPSPSGTVGTAVVASVSNLAPVLIVIPVLAALIFGIFLVPRRWAAEESRCRSEAKRDGIRHEIYYRLRYVERDHVVFDPVTGCETVAERADILTLIDRLAADHSASPH